MPLISRSNTRPLITGLLLASLTMPAQAVDLNRTLLSTAIAGTIASFGLACYQQKTPCTLAQEMASDRRSVSVDLGRDDTLQNRALWLGMDWQGPIYESDRFIVNGRWALNLQYWYSNESGVRNDNGYILGLTPVFRYQYKADSLRPYLETGIGPQYLSDVWLENDNKSTQFQFGSILGIGVAHDGYEIGYRYQHISNNNIQTPNPDTDIHNIHIGWHF
ncbi:acyloxyacyl hydrolase [Thiomicrospira sp. WB1]|uniref:acyloxyacyl hydrolase n=1 Tax=Thiomicrospira sp. WB1 TaxID=1685380 RepID=UPI000748CA0D|nr:acyloxyacyl hydrolase [Thiomicrospira sp. WB1]KUJ71349.1 hypothetical protein AVO41_07400 [Thiomicrospira sp. WB1]